MMGLRFMDEVPFHTVYIHALVRDERGKKMSKSKGNVMDPLDLFDEYGTDAVRFTLTALAVQGRDVNLSRGRIEGYRNFATKLWNAARYCQMNDCLPVAGFDPGSCRQTVNRWIVGKTAEAAMLLAEALDAYKFNEAADILYHFTWGTFCDWYLEFTKPILEGTDMAAGDETRATTGWVLDQLLHLMHPLMPYITEELWRKTAAGRPYMLIDGRWPELDRGLVDDAAEADMDWVVRLVSQIRSVRSEMRVPPSTQVALFHKDAGETTRRRLKTYRSLVARLARISDIHPVDEVRQGSVQVVVDEAVFVLPLAGIIDIPGEKARLEKEIAKLDDDIALIDRKLANPGFLAKAPEDVVDEQRERRETALRDRSKRSEALERLAGM